MEWLTCIRKALEYIENNLLEDIDLETIAKELYISPMYLHKGFTTMTGYSIGEYIRNRRLYQAALDLNNERIIDIAIKYHYETQESFTKAFSRFHGATPNEIKKGISPINSFLPLKINISIIGGINMKYTIKNLEGFKVVGFAKEFSIEESNKSIPDFWDEALEKYEQAFVNNIIGEYGICIDSNNKSLTYLIGGKYEGGNIPEGMMLYEFNDGEWAIFDCVGPMPKSIQDLSDKIYKEWLPANPDFELNGNANVEWYDTTMQDNQAPNYHSAVWIPVKRKK